LSSPEAALKAFVAFANAAGGALLIGLEDKTRHAGGVSDPLDLDERGAMSERGPA
jgi:predicted HTH transcriptional regulator